MSVSQVREEEGRVRREGQPTLFWRAWHASPRRGVIVRLHGIESHAGWYTETSEALARAGFTVYFVDRRGSGRSEGPRGDIPHRRVWLHDVAAALNDVRWREEVETVHLMANCWGAKPALAFAAMHPRRLASVVVIAPALILRTYYTRLEQIAIALRWVFNPSHRRPHPVDDPGYFTRDPARVAKITADPLSLHDCTDRFFAHTRHLTASLKTLLPRVSVPVLALFGGCDQVLDLPKTHALLRRVPAELLTVKTYPGEWHMIEFEPVRAQVVEDIVAWLDRQGRGAASVGEQVMRVEDIVGHRFTQIHTDH